MERVYCRRCHNPVKKSEVEGYAYCCAECYEDLYEFEVLNATERLRAEARQFVWSRFPSLEAQDPVRYRSLEDEVFLTLEWLEKSKKSNEKACLDR